MKYLLILWIAIAAAAQPITITGQNNVVFQGKKISSTTGDCLVITNSTNITIKASEIGPCAGNAIKIIGGESISILDSYIHPEGSLAGCCDHTDGVFASGTKNLLIQGNVIAYGEANIEVQQSTTTTVRGNFLLNPRNSRSRGQQFQCSDHCVGVMVDQNYTLASKDPKYKFAANQEDAINLIGGPTGVTSAIVVKGNYITGGTSGSGCGAISDASVDQMQIANNTLVETGQCGIGVASGSNLTITGNRVKNTMPIPGAGNTGLYIWNQYSSPCGPVAVTGNIISAVNTAGQDNSYWTAGNCGTITLSGNTFGPAALPLLASLPAPLIPPIPSSCVAVSPYSNQTSLPSCNATPPPVPITSSVNLTPPMTPAGNAACVVGALWADTGFIYVCTASGTVKRAPLSGF